MIFPTDLNDLGFEFSKVRQKIHKIIVQKFVREVIISLKFHKSKFIS